MESTFTAIEDFAKEVQRIQNASKDFVAPSFKISLKDDNAIVIDGVDSEFLLNDYANGQLASRLGIPKNYWDKCNEIPGLRSVNANCWFANSEKGRMIRTLDGKARAIVSDQYMRIDNFPVLDAIFPILSDANEKYGMQIVSHALSETRMYLQIVFPKKQGEVKVGDVVQAGVTIMNSEVGAGAYDISHWIRRLKCMNGMTGDSILRKHHLGGRIDTDEDGNYIFKSDTIQSELHTIALKSRDALDDAINGNWFAERLSKMKDSAVDVVAKPVETVERAVKLLSLPEYTKNLLLTNMIEDGELSRWGLANAVTALAHHESFTEPDKAYSVEVMGEQILNLNKRDWAALTA